MELKIRDTRIKEKFVVDDEYLNGYARLCGIYATGVYCSLCRHSNYSTQECWPEMRTIAEELGISRPSVIRAIEILESWNIIKIIKEKDEFGRQKNNVYILIDKSEWKPKTTSRVSDVDPDSRVNHRTEPGQPQNKSRVSDVDHKESHKDTRLQSEGGEDAAKAATPTPREEFLEFLKSQESEIQKLIAERGAGSEQFVRREIDNFIGHWTERTAGGKKQRWELEKTFELRRRLATWFRNSEEWGKGKKADDPRQIGVLKL